MQVFPQNGKLGLGNGKENGEIIEMAKNCTQYISINHVKKSIVDEYRDACVNPDNCYSCNN